MKREFVTYWPGKQSTSLMDVKQRLPAWVREATFEEHGLENSIWVDTSRTAAIAYLDRTLKIGRRKRVIRELRVEIDESEIDAFDYFFIWVTPDLEWRVNIEFDFTRPTCRGASGGSKKLSRNDRNPKRQSVSEACFT